MRLVFAGTPQTAVPSLEALLRSRHEVAAVITRPDARAGRGRRLAPSPVALWAGGEGLEVLKPTSVRDEKFLHRLRTLAPDCCPITAYGALIPRSALGIPPQGWVNLHFSLLPAWRGAAPVPAAILHGDDVTGATTFRLVEELDAGPVYGVVTEPVRADDTAGDLLGRLAESGAELLVRTVDGIESGELRPAPQPADGVSYAPKLTPEDARVRWSAPAHLIGRRIRACTPAPGAWTTLGEERIKLGPICLPGEERPAGAGSAAAGAPAPGEVLHGRNKVLVGTADRPVALGDVQPPGKRWMTAVEWARGLRLKPGEPTGLVLR